MASNKSWNKIFKDHNISNHNFKNSPFLISAKDIKKSCHSFKNTNEKEVRILCKQDSREDRPNVFINNNLFILPVDNKSYFIIQGEGYVDIPPITTKIKRYHNKLKFNLDTSIIGDSEMQHIDFAYNSGLIQSFIGDKNIVLTIRGRKYTPQFSFNIGNQNISTQGVQTEVDAGYESLNKIVLLEAKNKDTKNTIIRQLYYPYRQYGNYTKKKIILIFFSYNHKNKTYSFWKFGFTRKNDYNSIKLIKSAIYEII